MNTACASLANVSPVTWSFIFCITKRVKSQGKFKIHWWVHQRCRYKSMGEAFLQVIDDAWWHPWLCKSGNKESVKIFPGCLYISYTLLVLAQSCQGVTVLGHQKLTQGMTISFVPGTFLPPHIPVVLVNCSFSGVRDRTYPHGVIAINSCKWNPQEFPGGVSPAPLLLDLPSCTTLWSSILSDYTVELPVLFWAWSCLVLSLLEHSVSRTLTNYYSSLQVSSKYFPGCNSIRINVHGLSIAMYLKALA